MLTMQVDERGASRDFGPQAACCLMKGSRQDAFPRAEPLDRTDGYLVRRLCMVKYRSRYQLADLTDWRT